MGLSQKMCFDINKIAKYHEMKDESYNFFN